MAVIQGDRITDLVRSSLPIFKKGEITDLTQPMSLQRCMVMGTLYKNKKVVVGGADLLEWRMDTADVENEAYHSALYQEDDVHPTTGVRIAQSHFRHTTVGYTFDRREPEMNRGRSQIVDAIELRRNRAMMGLSLKIEHTFFNKPVDSTDELTPDGLPMFIAAGATTPPTDGEFMGKNPTNFSTCKGIDSTLVEQWRNYYNAYTLFSRDDLVEKWLDAIYYTNFLSPDGGGDTSDPTANDMYMYITSWRVYSRLKRIAESRNDNLGFDLDPVGRKLRFQGNRVMVASKLDRSATNGGLTNPIYGVNWNWMEVVIMEGENFVETVQSGLSGMHTVTRVFVDVSHQLKCRNRREQFLLAQA